MGYILPTIEGPQKINACLRAVEKERQAQADECSSAGRVSGQLLDRLIDLLRWLSDSGFHGYEIIFFRPVDCGRRTICKDDSEVELVLENSMGGKACFRVSHVTMKQDFNEKEESSLISFGVLPSDREDDFFNIPWPEGRLFLVVSGEFACHLMEMKIRRDTRRWITRKHCHYCETKITEDTRLLEIRSGGIPCGGTENTV